MNISKQYKFNKLKLTLLKDGSISFIKIFSYKKLNRFEPDSSNLVVKK